MSDKPHTFDAKLEHLRLQKHVYDLVRVQNLSVKDVMKRNNTSNVKKITSAIFPLQFMFVSIVKCMTKERCKEVVFDYHLIFLLTNLHFTFFTRSCRMKMEYR